MTRRPTPQRDLKQEWRSAALAVGRLEERAGISSQAEHVRDVFPFHVNSETPFGSEAADRERLRDEAAGHRQTVERIRQVYFGIADLNVRKALIVAYREVDDLRHRASAASVSEAQARLDIAVNGSQSRSAAQWIAMGVAAASAYGAYVLGGAGPAFAMVAALTVAGQSGLLAEITDRDRRIRRAEAELQQAQRLAKETYRLEHTFSRSEAEIGTPEQTRR